MTASNAAHAEDLERWQKSQTTFTTWERLDSRAYHDEPKPHTVMFRCAHCGEVNYISPETLEVSG